ACGGRPSALLRLLHVVQSLRLVAAPSIRPAGAALCSVADSCSSSEIAPAGSWNQRPRIGQLGRHSCPDSGRLAGQNRGTSAFHAADASPLPRAAARGRPGTGIALLDTIRDPEKNTGPERGPGIDGV